MIVPDYIWGMCSVSLVVISTVPYVTKALKGINKPHIFTWIIWTFLTGTAFAVQYTSGAGAGSWATGVTSLCCFAILLASFRYGERHITRVDWSSFIASILIIPIWFVTDNAALAAVLVTAIDGLGYIPTGRKAWHKPHEEAILFHALANVKHVFSFLAMKTYTMGTAFYPASLLLFNGILVGLILARRHALKKPRMAAPDLPVDLPPL